MAMGEEPTTSPTGTRGGRLRWGLVLVALAVIVMRGLPGASALLGEAQSATNPIATAVIPTLPSTQQVTPAEYADYMISNMTLRDKIGQLIMIKLYGPTLSSDETQMLSLHIGGVLAFGDAVENTAQVRKLTSDLQHHAYLPLFIATDQEGGEVNRLAPVVGFRPGEMDIGATHDPSTAKAAGVQAAQDFANLGFNFNFAPVVDINDPAVNNAQLYGRMYSSDPHQIAQFADAYLQGFQQNGQFVACLKHFPGLGSSNADPHKTLPLVNKSVTQLAAHEFVPYQQLLSLGHVQAILVTHEMLPQIDPTYPASLSYAITTGLLRNTLGFDGLIVTDSLTGMIPIEAQYSVDQASLLAAEAGSDVLVGPFHYDQVKRTIDTMVNAVSSGALSETRINQSVHRILVEKIQMGLLNVPAGTVTPTVTAPGIPSPTPMAHKRDEV